MPFYFSIASYLQSRDHGRYSRKYIDNLIDREVTACNIASISKETFTLPPSVLKSLDRRWKHEHMKSKRKASGGAEDLNKSKNQINKNKSVPSKVEKSPPPTPPRPERVGQRMKVRCYVQMTRGNATIIKCFFDLVRRREPRKCLTHRTWRLSPGNAAVLLELAKRTENCAIASPRHRSDRKVRFS